ncbi:unnamed protein product [Cylicostephanus goldi]|uniref:Uncharacterized protein n=1 Tax=Cylicostephanus goldi TaxID=71465 RepID=A0A3P7MK91_CYLGO|nr:unnamed protein product [Cylicostephanus goldi]
MRAEALQRAETGAAHSARDLHPAAFNYYAQVDYLTHSKVQIGKMDVMCGKRQAKKFRTEALGMCFPAAKSIFRLYITSFRSTAATADIEKQGFMPTFKGWDRFIVKLDPILAAVLRLEQLLANQLLALSWHKAGDRAEAAKNAA